MSGVHALHDTYTGFLPPLLPVFIEKMGLSRTDAGMLMVFTQAPSLIQPFIGHLSDRKNLTIWVLLAPAMTAVLMSISGQISNFGILAALLIFVGLSSAIFHAVGPVIAGRLSGKNLGRGMSIWMLGGELGRMLGPIVIVSVITAWGLKNVPWLMIAGIGSAILLYGLIHGVSTKTDNGREPLKFRKAFSQMKPILLPLTGILWIHAFLLAGLTTYLPVFLTDEGESLFFSGAALTILQAAGAAGALAAGSLSDYLGRKKVLFILKITAPVITLLFLYQNTWTRIPLLLLMGFTVISTTPVLMAAVQESFPENRAMANGVYMCLSFVIRSVATIIIGALGDFYGLKIALTAASLCMLAGSPIVFLLPKRERSEK